ncbi:unnamed protein product [Moneuplotes crassus]|uniref:KOW domain-containing protein n=1 Tax=Euplotes crassus TaxID=5936 RepID=A0AAD1X4Q9_EUPCR|nr:unnamed protein product [Moneuplotes crassus]
MISTRATKEEVYQPLSDPSDDYEQKSEVVGNSPYKNKRRKLTEDVSKFIDDMADEDEGEDEEESEISEQERKKIYERYDRTKLEQKATNIYAEMDDDELEDFAKSLENKYEKGVEEQEEEDEARNLCPTVADPILWLVKCKQGSEREVCICLMNKYLQLKKEGNPLSIISATISDKIKGHLYIEAYKECHVREAIRGMNLIFQRSCRRIKEEETANVFEIDKSAKITRKKGQWVRLNTGVYSGDYGKIVEIDDNKDGCYLKLIPRIKTETVPDARVFKDKRRFNNPERPPLKFFNKEEVTEVAEKFSNIFKKTMYYWNRNYYRKGFLYKYFNVRNFDTENIIPPRAIFEKFHKPSTNFDDDNSSEEDIVEELEKWKTLASKSILLTKGDKIKVISGDLQNLTGKVVAIDPKVITIKPDIKDIPDNLDIDIRLISKHFNEGDHVTVVEGQYEGDKGMITKVSGERCIIFSESSQREFIAFLNNCKLTAQIAKMTSSNFDHGYNVFDLIITTNNTAGVVLGTEKDNLKVLTQIGRVRHIDINEISTKIFQKKNISTLDHNGNFMSIGDPVRVIDGPNRNLKAIIKNIHHNSIFLYNKEFIETLGYFVENNKSIAMRGAEDPSRRMMIPLTNKRNDPLLGKVVNICRGEYKGFEAKVTDIMEDRVKLELFFNNRMILLKREEVIEKGEVQLEKSQVKFEETDTTEVKTPVYQPSSPGWSYYDASVTKNESPCKEAWGT